MKLYTLKHIDIDFIAHEDISTGDILTKIYKKRLRKSNSADTQLFGASADNYKKGEIVEAVCDYLEI